MAYQYPSAPEETESQVEAPQAPETSQRTRRTPHRQTMMDEVATDLAFWIDDTANKVALAFAPGRAPFSAQLTEAQKLEFYTRQLFNPDGSPNTAGRSQQIARLGAEGFGQVYQAVVAAHPELKPPTDPTMEVPS